MKLQKYLVMLLVISMVSLLLGTDASLLAQTGQAPKTQSPSPEELLKMIKASKARIEQQQAQPESAPATPSSSSPEELLKVTKKSGGISDAELKKIIGSKGCQQKKTLTDELAKKYPGDPVLADCYFHTGYCYASKGNKEEAATIYQMILSNYPEAIYQDRISAPAFSGESLAKYVRLELDKISLKKTWIQADLGLLLKAIEQAVIKKNVAQLKANASLVNFQECTVGGECGLIRGENITTTLNWFIALMQGDNVKAGDLFTPARGMMVKWQEIRGCKTPEFNYLYLTFEPVEEGGWEWTGFSKSKNRVMVPVDQQKTVE